MNEPRVVESVTNECQSLGRAHESSSARAEQLIACLEGEIARREEELAACRIAVENCEVFRARIAELEARYQRDVYGLNNEGDPIGGDPAGGYANDNARLRSELAALKAGKGDAVAWIVTYMNGDSYFAYDRQTPSDTPLYAAPAAPAAPAADAWIPVSERLPVFPKKGKCFVLALQRGHEFPFPARWTGSRWDYLDGDTARNITHWMPLPAAHRAQGVV